MHEDSLSSSSFLYIFPFCMMPLTYFVFKDLSKGQLVKEKYVLSKDRIYIWTHFDVM